MKSKLKVSWRKRRAFLKKKIKERNCLWVFFCYMCCHTIADPDGILYRAGNCVRCGSGQRFDYRRANDAETFLFRHNRLDAYWDKIGYVPPDKAKEAVMIRILLDEEA